MPFAFSFRFFFFFLLLLTRKYSTKENSFSYESLTYSKTQMLIPTVVWSISCIVLSFVQLIFLNLPWILIFRWDEKGRCHFNTDTFEVFVLRILQFTSIVLLEIKAPKVYFQKSLILRIYPTSCILFKL